MRAGIIFLVGTIGLTGCTTMGNHRSGDWGDSGFPPTYPGGKSEYHPSAATENTSNSESDRYQRGDRRKKPDFDFARKQRKRALDELEKSLQKSQPRESARIKILYTVIIDETGTQAYITRDGEMTSQAELDTLCVGNTEPPRSVWIPDTIPHPPDQKCWCAGKDDADDGSGAYSHAHCTFVPWWWPW